MDYAQMYKVRRKVSMDFNPCLIWNLFMWRHYLFFPQLLPNARRASVDGILRSGGLKSHQDFWGRLRITLWGLTADPWTACGVDASVAAIRVIRTDTIKSLAWVHLGTWCKKMKTRHGYPSNTLRLTKSLICPTSFGITVLKGSNLICDLFYFFHHFHIFRWIFFLIWRCYKLARMFSGEHMTVRRFCRGVTAHGSPSRTAPDYEFMIWRAD